MPLGLYVPVARLLESSFLIGLYTKMSNLWQTKKNNIIYKSTNKKEI